MAKYLGLNSNTLQSIEDETHLQQSIQTILSTPLGSRIMRREIGSYVPDLIDQPANAMSKMRLMSATTMAIHRFEPRVRVIQIKISQQTEKLMIELTCARVDIDQIQKLKVFI